jgi:hypothetical protein
MHLKILPFVLLALPTCVFLIIQISVLYPKFRNITSNTLSLLSPPPPILYLQNVKPLVSTCIEIIRKNSVPTSQTTHYAFITKIRRLRLFRTLVFIVNRTTHVPSLCGQHAEFLNVAVRGTHNYHQRNRQLIFAEALSEVFSYQIAKLTSVITTKFVL